MTATPACLDELVYSALCDFQQTANWPQLQHAQHRQHLAEHIARELTLAPALQPASAFLHDVEAYLSALHGSVAHRDQLAASLACAGCELRDRITATLLTLTEPAAIGMQPEDLARMLAGAAYLAGSSTDVYDRLPAVEQQRWLAVARERLALAAAAVRRKQRTGEKQQPETDEERADREETEREHAAGIHAHCGVTCEVELPTEHLRNFVLAKGYPGTAGALDELLRRASVKSTPLIPRPQTLVDDEAPARAYLLAEGAAARSNGAQHGASSADVVAYRSHDGRQLRCPAHAPAPNLIGLDWSVLTWLEVDGDGSRCTEAGCGVDVLADEAQQDGAES